MSIDFHSQHIQWDNNSETLLYEIEYELLTKRTLNKVVFNECVEVGIGIVDVVFDEFW